MAYTEIMLFELKVRKEGFIWIAEFPLGGARTEGTTAETAMTALQRRFDEEIRREFGIPGLIEERSSGGHYYLQTFSPSYLFAVILRAQRQARGLSLREAADRAGLKSHSAWYQYEIGKRCPTLEQMCHFLIALGDELEPVITIQAA